MIIIYREMVLDVGIQPFLGEAMIFGLQRLPL